MSDWAAGYVLDIPYTSGFYREMAPPHLEFVALANGMTPPALGKGAAYCELACGQGFGTNLMAAANPDINFWGFDFNPGQVANARRLAAEAGLTNVTFEDLSFEEAVSLPADRLPDFDVIALHGIYSWISEENRRHIVEFLRKKLKPGGLVYISYNCMPGWAALAPLQRLMREHANRHPDRSDMQADAALAFVNQLKDGGAAYFNVNPIVGPRVAKMPSHNKNYLAHEYLNGYWHPLYHLDVARELEDARLTYIGSATIAENIDLISVPKGLHDLLGATRDRGWQETIRDYASNKQFRRDIFMRGPTPLPPVQRHRRLAELKLALAVPRKAASHKFQGPLGEVAGQEQLYGSIYDALAEGNKTIADLIKLPHVSERGLGGAVQAAAMLVHSGAVFPVISDGQGSSKSAKQFNRAVAARAQNGDVLSFIAAPAIGSGIPAGYADQIGLLLRQEKKGIGVKDAAAAAWNLMSQTGQRMMKDGAAVHGAEENLKSLEENFTSLFQERWPIWQRLGIV